MAEIKSTKKRSIMIILVLCVLANMIIVLFKFGRDMNLLNLPGDWMT